MVLFLLRQKKKLLTNVFNIIISNLRLYISQWFFFLVKINELYFCSNIFLFSKIINNRLLYKCTYSYVLVYSYWTNKRFIHNQFA